MPRAFRDEILAQSNRLNRRQSAPAEHAFRIPLAERLALAEPLAPAQIAAWCDEYMARLAITTTLTRSRNGQTLTARTSGTDKAVLGALCSLMRERDCSCVRASEVEIAARASFGNADTAARALRRLEDAAYLIRHPNSSCCVADSYTLVIERLDRCDADGARPLRVADVTKLESLATGDLSDAAYRAKNLGKTAASIYTYLAAHPDRTMAELARDTGRHKTTIKNNLDKMRVLGMADEEDGRWRTYTRRIKTDDDLPDVVEAAARRRANARRVKEEEQANKRYGGQILAELFLRSIATEGKDPKNGLLRDA